MRDKINLQPPIPSPWSSLPPSRRRPPAPSAMSLTCPGWLLTQYGQRLGAWPSAHQRRWMAAQWEHTFRLHIRLVLCLGKDRWQPSRVVHVRQSIITLRTPRQAGYQLLGWLIKVHTAARVLELGYTMARSRGVSAGSHC